MNYWLVKQEPEAYSWTQFLKDKRTAWTGVRNYQARNNLRAMRKGDPVLFYHSVSEKQIVGVAAVAREAYPDTTAEDGDDWVAVDLTPVRTLKHPVALEAVKKDDSVKNIQLIRQSRLSVTSLTKAQFDRLIAMSEAFEKPTTTGRSAR